MDILFITNFFNRLKAYILMRDAFMWNKFTGESVEGKIVWSTYMMGQVRTLLIIIIIIKHT